MCCVYLKKPRITNNIFSEEALLNCLHDRRSFIRKLDAGNQLKIENHDDLNEEFDQPTDFHIASITMAIVTALFKECKWLSGGLRSFSSSHSSDSNSSHSKHRPPKLQLPFLVRSYNGWMIFLDLFKVAVNSNAELTIFEKLSYLKACVKGDLARLVNSVSISD